MRAIMESLFDAAYLVVIITLGIIILRGARGRKPFRLFGIMAIVLGCGDAFHLVPRIWVLNTIGPAGAADYAAALGFGTLVTSITMTVFYVLLYHFWRRRFNIQGRTGLSAAIYILAAARVILCLFPQNQWLRADAPLAWGIYRNIPFAILGLCIIVLFCGTSGKAEGRALRLMWLGIALSFAFYIPVVLWVDAVPAIGMLMLPKTCAYVWMVWMGYRDMKG
jgi:hypothetical protein